jgi:hypothetical protein
MREEGRKNSVGVSEKNRRTWDVRGSNRWDEGRASKCQGVRAVFNYDAVTL